ncbi:hypothetical protein PSI23_11520 [Xenorhabdus sp. XENO-10]|uniref:Uncharacterized protein n=1 Tax=Xenorhabdus yunnanensis TaxID=3025878 RepID=A0ABT5LFL6_9GAMM|nr:hypothetical protein [Xenorhabdus yunnanensis]MDC9589911.1 hypothetical protein [Xenorhabdus yunnanensis]
MNRKLVACILSLIIGTTIAANATAMACNMLAEPLQPACKAVCEKIPGDGALGLLKAACI